MPDAARAEAPEAGSLRGAAALRLPESLAAELLGLFERVAQVPDKLQWVHRYICADLGEPLDAPLQRACEAVAASVDGEPAVFDRHGYHNRQHFCEVALTAYSLCQIHRLRAATTQFVVLAALIHDVVYEGGWHRPFAHERASVDRMRPLLAAAGLSAAQIDQLMVLVLATDLASGTPFMAAACAAHARSAAAVLTAPAGAPELMRLLDDAALAQLARLLCEADVLPSLGLDAGYAMRVQERLSREWRRPLSANDKVAFIDMVLAQGYIGEFYLPCVQATRAALAGASDAVVAG